VTWDTPNSAIDGMICKLVEEITANLSVLDLPETPIEVFLVIDRIQADSFYKFNSIPAFIILQTENISATNGRVVAPFCMSVPTLCHH
jgi:hypothetical protein